MIITKLYLSSFGKFSNKEVVFTNGLNVVYGLNEKGKSTIHKFIEGMFFGFFKPLVKNRSLLDDHEKYHPRNKSEYFGSMEITYNKNNYLLYRDFNKSKPKVTLTNLTTGEDITESLPVHSSTKLPDIASFFSLNYTIYKNTISVSQIEGKDDTKNLSSTVVETLTNLNTTRSEEISLSKVQDSIQTEIDQIGTKRSPTKPLAKLVNQIEKLELEKAESEIQYRSIFSKNQLLLEKNKLANQLAKKQEELESKQFALLNEQKKEKVQKAVLVQEEIDTYQNNLSQLEQYKNISLDIVERFDFIIEQKQENQNNLIKVDEDIQKLRQHQEDIYPTLNRLNYDLKRSYIDSEVEIIRNKLPRRLTIIVFTLLTLGIYFILYNLKSNKMKNEIETLNLKKQDLNSSEIKIGQYQDSLSEYHKTVVFSEKLRISAKMSEVSQLYSDFIECANEIKLYDSRIEEKETNKQFLLEKINGLKQQQKDILQKYNASSKEELAQMVLYKKEYDQTNFKINESKKRLFDILGNQNIHTLKEEVHFDISTEFKQEFLDEVTKEMKDNYKEQIDLNNATNVIQNEVSYIERNYRDVDLIMQELAFEKNQLSILESKLQSLAYTQKVLTTLSDEISYEFAPVLNNEVSAVMKKITNGKYSDLKIDKLLHVRVFDDASKTHEDSAFFSKGTMDQLDLARRIGMNNIISSEIYPFIFDDTFVNYDDERLQSVLQRLWDETKNERQIILLTCHDREKVLLENNKLAYNYLKI